MTTRRPTLRVRHARRPDAPSVDEPTRAAAEQCDVPDSPGAAASVESVAPARGDGFPIDVESADRPESGSIEAVELAEGGGGIPASVESHAAADEGEASEGDPRH
jgi:hypothetical protein